MIVLCVVMSAREPGPVAGEGQILVRVSRHLVDELLAEPSGPVALVGVDDLEDGTYDLTFKRVDAIVLS